MGFTPEDAFTAELKTLLRIALDLKEATTISCPPSHSPLTTSNVAVIGAFSLPSPQPLLPSLLEAGITPKVASATSRIYQQRAGELKQHIQDSLATTYRKAAESPRVLAHVSPPDLLIKRVTPIFTDIYFRRLGEWKEELIQRVKHASEPPLNTPSRNSRTFNLEYVPLLERFFKENPFPTHADKIFLAQKSNMQYKQIHVWFQNRRNRTKKEGKTLRKKPTYEGAMTPLERLYERVKGRVVDSDCQAPKLSKVGSTEQTTEDVSNESFASTSPAHAFPSPYPPTCNYDPFPCKSDHACFSKPVWRRLPDGNYPLPLSTSIDDLVETFSHLNVRDGTGSKGTSKLQSHAATSAITVIPSRAPHPSLMICKYSQPANIAQPRPLVHAPVPCPKAFRSPSPNSKPVTLVPLSTLHKKNRLTGKRKTAPLPQRFTGRTQDTCRDATLPESYSASSPSPRWFSTDSDAHGCSFSSIGSLSPLSDAANIQEQPHLFWLSCCSPFDSPIHLHGLRDMVVASPPSVS